MAAPLTYTDYSFKGFVDWVVGSIESTIIPLLIALIALTIIWKVIDAWVINADDIAKRDSAKMTAFIGIIVMAVILSIWGILTVLYNSLF